MANLKEQEKWEDGIYQIEENDPVLGGEDGITNKPAKQLANRTLWLKKALELLTGKSKPKDLTADSASNADKDGHSHALPKSSTSQQGIVQLDDTWESDSREKAPTARVIKAMKQLFDSLTRNLSNYIPNSKKSNAVNSPSSETVATSAAAKTAFDKGVEALNKANQVDAATLKKNGNQSINGVLKAENVGNAWAAYKFGAKQGEWQLEVHPDSHTAGNRRFNMLWLPTGGNRVYLSFPHVGDNGETVAYQSWVNAELQKVRSIANQNSQNFSNYIHNNKKSNAVDSTSTDTLATSRAVKLAFDRGTTALNVANEAVHFNRNYFAGDLNSLNDKHEICYLEQAQTKNRNFPSNAYQWGILHVYSNGTLGSQVYYADNGELWGRTRWHSHDWNNWKRLDGIDNVSKSGDTMTGNLTIDTADSLLKGKRNGTNKYAIGLRNSSSDDAIFVNYTYDTALELLRDSVRSNKTLISTGMIIENSDYAGLNLKNLSNRYVRIEGNPHSAANMLTFAYREANGSNINVVGLPRKSGTLALLEDMRNVNRRDYSRTIKGTNPNWDAGTSKNIAVTGFVIIYPDGKIEQFFHFKAMRVPWFAPEDALGVHERAFEIPVQLWTAMPHKIVYATAQFTRPVANNITAGGESEEWTMPLWNMQKQGSSRDRCHFTTSRFLGSTDEPIDFLVKVEGY